MSNNPLFQEIYSCYYGIIASSLSRLNRPSDLINVRRIVEEESLEYMGFPDAPEAIVDILSDNESALLTGNYKSTLTMPPELPLTLAQKRWMKALLMDPRIKLFDIDAAELDDIQPLFLPNTIVYYDQYADGDDYSDECYQCNFKLLITAIKNKQQVRLIKTSSKGNTIKLDVFPYKMEYSIKDDKFRVIVSNNGNYESIKISSITSVELLDKTINCIEFSHKPNMSELKLSVIDDKDTVSRAMAHFSDYRKETIKLNDKEYLVTISYDTSDEHELINRVLQFGTTVKVLEPDRFKSKLKERLFKQVLPS